MYRNLMIALLLLAGLTAVSVASADEFKLLMWVEGISGPEDQLGSWIEASNFVHHIPGMPSTAQLMDASPTHLSIDYRPEEGATDLARTVKITKRVDQTTPLLFKLCREGAAIPHMRLVLVSPARQQVIGNNFEEVKVTCIAVRAPGFGDRAGVSPVEQDKPIEELEIQFRHVTAAIEDWTR